MAARGAPTYGVERMAALSDGLFAIVLTLLVLDLKLPEPPAPGDELLAHLGDNLHDFVGWFVSFLALARLWIVHHVVLARVERCHLGTIVLNFALLAAISVMPFTSSLIGTYETGEPWAIVFFALNLAAAGAALGALARHIAREPELLHAEHEPESLEWHWKHHLLVLPAVAGVVALLAFVHPLVAVGALLAEFAAVTVIALRGVYHRSHVELTR
jgi:uncharacterized membrane protein